jgi:hypothetical protein
MSPFLQKYFKSVAMAEVGRSAEHARELGYLRPADRVVMNRFELLEIAKAELRALAAAGYRPPLRASVIPALGRSGISTIKAFMVNMLEGGHISQHDYLIGSKVATVTKTLVSGTATLMVPPLSTVVLLVCAMSRACARGYTNSWPPDLIPGYQ